MEKKKFRAALEELDALKYNKNIEEQPSSLANIVYKLSLIVSLNIVIKFTSFRLN